MRVSLAAFVILMILGVVACVRHVVYTGPPYTTGLCKGDARWAISLYESQLLFHLRWANTPEGFLCEERPSNWTIAWYEFVRPVRGGSTTYENADFTGERLEGRTYGIPLFPLALLFLVLWAFLFWKQRQRRRLLAWLASGPRCQSCDYNLTGNTSGLCPECGTAIPDDVKEEIKAPPADGPVG